MWKKLLVPHDFSPCAARALRTAAELAKVHGAQLELVHVAALPASLPPETMISPTAGARPLCCCSRLQTRRVSMDVKRSIRSPRRRTRVACSPQAWLCALRPGGRRPRPYSTRRRRRPPAHLEPRQPWFRPPGGGQLPPCYA